MKNKKHILLFFLIALLSLQAQGQYWKLINNLNNAKDINPSKYNSFQLNTSFLKSVLHNAPHEKQGFISNSNTTIDIPMPDGTYQKFLVLETEVMHHDLLVQFPNIKTYNIIGIDDKYANGVIDLTEYGFHAMIRTPLGEVYVDPYSRWDNINHLSYYVNDLKKELNLNNAYLTDDLLINSTTDEIKLKTTASAPCIGAQLRNYRVAIACTKEYAIAATGNASPTITQVLSKVVTTLNRVDGVLQNELAIKLTLVPSTTLVLFTSSFGSGFTTQDNSNANTLINQSQSIITATIGSANFDLGHTFSTGGGGLAELICVCRTSSKARGITGSSNPVGDPYDIDYVAHEMGHQLGGSHTFNSQLGSCGGNRSANKSVEPGSGLTVMSYAGICGNDNITSHSIPYYHAASFDEIVNLTINGSGNTCGTLISTGNNPPNVPAIQSYVIPVGTPFSLTGAATDPDNDALTYSWEATNIGSGNGGPWNNGTTPYFRSYTPTTSVSRSFPILSSILAGPTTYTTVKGEYLTSSPQILTFRFTARDNKLNGGGICYNTTTVTTLANTAPFEVTSQNTPNIGYSIGTSQLVTWSVGNTTLAAINCQNVNIALSVNNGSTFTVIVANTPNDGSEQIVIPNVNSSQCRIKVYPVNNIFFDINNFPFTISVAAMLNSNATENDFFKLYPNPVSNNLNIDLNLNKINANTVVAYVYNMFGQLVLIEKTVLNNKLNINTSSLFEGIYSIVISDDKVKMVQKFIKQ